MTDTRAKTEAKGEPKGQFGRASATRDVAEALQVEQGASGDILWNENGTVRKACGCNFPTATVTFLGFGTTIPTLRQRSRPWKLLSRVHCIARCIVQRHVLRRQAPLL